MRKLLVILLAALLLCGCAADKGIHFYYLRTEYEYGTADGVIASETREITGYDDDLNYLFRLYLEGPLNDSLTSPFPRGTYLLNTLLTGDTLTLVLSVEYSALEDLEQTLANACLASTGFQLTEAEQIIILSGKETYTLDRSSITLFDDTVAETASE